MSKSENIQAFEAALAENKELHEKYEAALKRIVENKEAANDGEALVKAAAEVGFTVTMAELERSVAQNQELSDDDLEMVSGGCDCNDHRGECFYDYSCTLAFKHGSTCKTDECFYDYRCNEIYKDSMLKSALESEG
jgi:predicted ribosomally synthesized peptide with nif11-like leader